MNKQIEQHFCSFEQSLALADIGFGNNCYQENYRNCLYFAHLDEPTAISLYEEGVLLLDHIGLPLKSQAIDFFAEKFGLFGWVFKHNHENLFSYELADTPHKYFEFESKHEAESALIDKLIELAQAKDK